MKSIGKKIFYVCYLSIVIIAALEIILRIYNPIDFRQKGDKVVLPRNQQIIFSNGTIPVIEKKTVHTKNSLGFRGPEIPDSFYKYTSIIGVGGSAMECFYLDDANYWTKLISDELRKSDTNIWINNAAYQGHSTYGHFILIDSYIKQLKPDYIILMAGFNEINRYDIMQIESVSKYSKKNTLWGWFKSNSEVLQLIVNIKRHVMAYRLSVTDRYLDLKNPNIPRFHLSDFQIDSAVKVQLPLIKSYKKRLQEIVDTSIANNIKMILVTQPILCGEGKDPNTGSNLETVGFGYGYNGLLTWRLLEGYNDATREIAKENAIHLIDLASEMPKSSLYFYDICHFTNQGSGKVSEIISKELRSVLVIKK